MKEYFESFIRNYDILTEEDISLIMSRTEVVAFKKGSQIPVQDNCYLVLKGCVREYLIKKGTEKTTAFYMEGDSIVAPPEDKSEKYWSCLEDCIATMSNQTMEREICELIPRLRTIILDEVQNMSHQAKEDLALFISSSPEERYKNLLENNSALLQRASQHHIASYIGITPESLSRLRKRMKLNL